MGQTSRPCRLDRQTVGFHVVVGKGETGTRVALINRSPMRMSASGGGFNRSAQHLLVLLDQGVAHGDVTDMVHGGAESGAVGALEEWVECCSDLPDTGSEEQDWRSANCDAPWRHRAGAAPESFGRAQARGTRRDFPGHCRGPVDPTDCTWPWTSAVDGEPGAQA